jgi:hypothetical protein
VESGEAANRASAERDGGVPDAGVVKHGENGRGAARDAAAHRDAAGRHRRVDPVPGHETARI